MLADYKEAVRLSIFSGRVIRYHSDYFIVIINIYATNSGSCSSKGSCIVLIEAAAASMTTCKQDFALSVCHDRIEKLVTLTYCNRDHTVCTRS